VNFPPKPTSSERPDDERIETIAAAWLAQRDDGFSAEEEAEFSRWQQADPRHGRAVARLEQTWATLQQLREFRPESRVHPDRDLLARTPKLPTRILHFPTAAIIAGLAAVLVFGAITWWPKPPADRGHAFPTYTTTADGYQRVTLEDGSVLDLNGNSLVQVNYTDDERRIHLVRGEVFFTVAKNKQRPFVVMAGSVAVRAVGTAFNVRMGKRDVEVLVAEGRVKVENHEASAIAPNRSPELGVGQRLIISSMGLAVPQPLQVQTLPLEAVRESLAWQEPRLRFVDTPLVSVVAQFNRRNKIQIELRDATLHSMPVDGSFRAENVEAFIRLIESTGQIATERIGDDRIVLSRAR
jgi:transmembrane sensor